MTVTLHFQCNSPLWLLGEDTKVWRHSTWRHMTVATSTPIPPCQLRWWEGSFCKQKASVEQSSHNNTFAVQKLTCAEISVNLLKCLLGADHALPRPLFWICRTCTPVELHSCHSELSCRVPNVPSPLHSPLSAFIISSCIPWVGITSAEFPQLQHSGLFLSASCLL